MAHSIFYYSDEMQECAPTNLLQKYNIYQHITSVISIPSYACTNFLALVDTIYRIERKGTVINELLISKIYNQLLDSPYFNFHRNILHTTLIFHRIGCTLQYTKMSINKVDCLQHEDKVFFGNLDKGPLDLNDKLDLNVTRCIYVLKDWKVSNYFEALLLLVEL